MTLDTLLARNIEGFVLKLSATRPNEVYVTIPDSKTARNRTLTSGSIPYILSSAILLLAFHLFPGFPTQAVAAAPFL